MSKSKAANQRGGQQRPERARDPVRNALVVISMTVVTMAFGIGLYLQFGMAFWLAVVAALAVYLGLISAHVLIRRAETMQALRREIAELRHRLAEAEAAAAQVPAPHFGEPAPAPVRDDAAPAIPRHAAHAEREAARAPAAPAHHARLREPALETRGAAPPGLQPVGRMFDELDVPAPRGGDRAQPALGLPATAAPPAAVIAAAAGDDSMHRYWGFRPAAEAAPLPEIVARPTVAKPPPPSAAAEPPPRSLDILAELGSASVIASTAPATSEAEASQPALSLAEAEADADDDHIKGVIRQLAADINAGRRGLSPPLPVTLASEPATAVDTAAPAIDPSVEALRAAARSMRTAADQMADSVLAQAAAPQGGQQQRLAEISQALASQSLDVLLEPILGLGDQRAEHYEVTVRLRLATGEALEAVEVTETCKGSGLMPLLDALRVERTARVARKMEERQKPGSVMSQLSAESLASDQFLNEFADTYRVMDTATERLVLSFTQADIRVVNEMQWVTLKDMADLGFRFAIEAVTDLDMDFEQLAESGFAFVKLDARVFLEGLATASGRVPPGDLCRHFAGLGFTLIVGHIDDERQLAEVVGFGAVLGQGRLFGAPRPVRADIVASRRLVAA